MRVSLHGLDQASSCSLEMADQGEQVPQVPAGKNLQAAQAVSVAHPPLPPPPPPQNQEEPANPGQNAAGEEVTLEVCSAFCFIISSTCSSYCIPVAVLNLFSVRVMPCFKHLVFSLAGNSQLWCRILPC